MYSDSMYVHFSLFAVCHGENPAVAMRRTPFAEHHSAWAYALAGTAGFEPADEGVKVPCLTTWRRPNINAAKSYLSRTSLNSSYQ